VLRPCRAKQGRRVGRELGRRLEPPAREFLESNQCRQISIDKEMDGREDRQQCDPDKEKCVLVDRRVPREKGR